MATFNIYSLRDKAPLRVTGVKVGAFGVARQVLNFSGKLKRGEHWGVTHIPTGHAIATFIRRRDALLLAETLNRNPAVWSSRHWRFGCDRNKKLARRKYYAEAKALLVSALAKFRREDFA